MLIICHGGNRTPPDLKTENYQGKVFLSLDGNNLVFGAGLKEGAFSGDRW